MIVLRGVDRFLGAVDLKVEQMRRATEAATAKALHLIEKAAKQKLGIRSHQRGTPTPSAPGDPPALISGNLRRSITVTGPEPITANSWRGQVGPTAAYGRIQELGGDITSMHTSMVMMGTAGSGIRLPARPYMQPAYDDSKDEIRAIFEAAWSEAILK
jgi:phage gpG-like protein